MPPTKTVANDATATAVRLAFGDIFSIVSFILMALKRKKSPIRIFMTTGGVNAKAMPPRIYPGSDIAMSLPSNRQLINRKKPMVRLALEVTLTTA